MHAAMASVNRTLRHRQLEITSLFRKKSNHAVTAAAAAPATRPAAPSAPLLAPETVSTPAVTSGAMPGDAPAAQFDSIELGTDSPPASPAPAPAPVNEPHVHVSPVTSQLAAEASDDAELDSGGEAGSPQQPAAGTQPGQKLAKKYKTYTPDQQAYALEVLGRMGQRDGKPKWSKAVQHLRDHQPATYRKLRVSHLQYSDGDDGPGDAVAPVPKKVALARAAEVAEAYKAELAALDGDKTAAASPAAQRRAGASGKRGRAAGGATRGSKRAKSAASRAARGKGKGAGSKRR